MKYLISFAVLVMSFGGPLAQAQFELDPAFVPNLPPPVVGEGWYPEEYEWLQNTVDGKYYIINRLGSTLYRINNDGQVDTGFRMMQFVGDFSIADGWEDSQYKLILQQNGDLVLTGLFTIGGSKAFVARFRPDGTPVPGVPPVRVPPEEHAFSVKVVPTRDAAHYVVHYEKFTEGSSIPKVLVAEAASGKILTGFPPPGTSLLHPQDNQGRFLAVGYPLVINGNNHSIARYLSTFQLDTSFSAPVFTNSDGNLELEVRESFDRYYVAVNFWGDGTTINGLPAKNLYRLRANGTIDPAFAPFATSVAAYPKIRIEDISTRSADSGELLVLVPAAKKLPEEPDLLLKRINAQSGEIDTRFNVKLNVGMSSSLAAEFTDDDKVAVHGWGPLVDGREFPDGAYTAIYNKDGRFVRYDYPANALLQRWDGLRLRGVGPPERTLLYNGWQVFNPKYERITHVDGVPAEGLIFAGPDGKRSRSVVVMPTPKWSTVSVKETKPGELLLTGNFSAINGHPRPGVARLIYRAGRPAQWTGTYSLTENKEVLSRQDTDGDGISDLLELALGLHPLISDVRSLSPGVPSGLPAAIMRETEAARALEMRFPRRRDRVSLGLTYFPEFSSDLRGPWTAGTEARSEAVDDVWEVVTVRDNASTAQSRQRYCRVRVKL